MVPHAGVAGRVGDGEKSKKAGKPKYEWMSRPGLGNYGLGVITYLGPSLGVRWEQDGIWDGTISIRQMVRRLPWTAGQAAAAAMAQTWRADFQSGTVIANKLASSSTRSNRSDEVWQD